MEDKLRDYIVKQLEKKEIKDSEIGGKAFEIFGFYKLRKKQYDEAL